MAKAPFVLLINPWITDFAAYDLWAKPMGLLILASLLREGGCGTALVDCLDRNDPFTDAHPGIIPGKARKFGTGKYARMLIPKPEAYAGFPRRYYRHGIHPESFRRKLRDVGRPDIIWVTSIMTYWYPGVQETIRAVREEYPETPVWLGGIYAGLCSEHAAATSGAHRVVTGPLSALPALIAEQTGFSVTNDPAWRDFQLRPFPAIDLMPNTGYAPVLTSVGCPYRCPYCASGRLQPDWKRFGPDRVYSEIVRAHDLLGVEDFAFYDDALLLKAEETLKPALERLVTECRKFRFHVPNALHIRALSPDWCRLLHDAGFRTIRLGLETTTDAKNRAWGGKVDTRMFLAGLKNMFDAGFEKEDIGVYLLCGLPGQSPQEVAEAIRTVREAGIRPHLAEYSPIPGTPMWNGAAALSGYDIAAEPLFHNNTFFACRRPDFTYEDMVELKKLAR